MNLLQFSPEPLRPEIDDDVDQELWQPDWACFCCHDTGLIAGHLLRQIMPGFNDLKHKRVACQRSGCEASYNYNDEYHDQQIPADICEDLDRQERQMWRDQLFAQADRIQSGEQYSQESKIDITALVNARRMPGSRGRTANDEREVEIKRSEQESMTIKDWLEEYDDQEEQAS